MSYVRHLVRGLLLTHAWVCSIRALNPILESQGQPALMLVGKKLHEYGLTLPVIKDYFIL